MSRATSKFGDYAVHNEWQAHKSGEYLFKHAKKDRKKVGELRKYRTGEVEFLIERRAEELVFCKEAWAIDKPLLSLMRCLGSPTLRILVSNGDDYRISFADLDAKKYNSPDSKHVMRWFVRFEDFSFVKGEPESIESMLKVGKWK